MNLKKYAAALLAIIPLIAYSLDNTIHLDQAGDSSTIAMTQDGNSNTIKGLTEGNPDLPSSAKIRGTGNNVDITQTGNSNLLSLDINTTTSGSVAPEGTDITAPTIKYSVTGDSAIAVIDINKEGVDGKGATNYVNIAQVGNFAMASVRISGANNAVVGTSAGGDSNSLTFTAFGNKNTAKAEAKDGSGNQLMITQGSDAFASSGNQATIKSSGVTNILTIIQQGGTTGNSANIQGYDGTGTALTGNSNTVAINQGGPLDSTATVGITGNSNTVTVNQTSSSSGSGQNDANIKVNGSTNTITITQNNK